jgi:DNA-binding XRE family transcriptional regulator
VLRHGPLAGVDDGFDQARDSITSKQCRAARAWLDWTLDDLVESSAVSKATLVAFEKGKRLLQERTARDIRRAFEDAGIEFLFDGPKAVGIRVVATKSDLMGP